MSNEEKIREIIFSAIDEVNETLPEERRMKKDVDTILYGEEGTIDSLELTLFIVAVEERIEASFDTELSLTDELTTSSENSPVQSIHTIENYIVNKLQAKIPG